VKSKSTSTQKPFIKVTKKGNVALAKSINKMHKVNL
jgi:hypothetical protein